MNNERVILDLDRLSAERLCRALRQLTADPNPQLFEMLHDLGYSVAAELGMTSDSDSTDPIDEHLVDGDDIGWHMFRVDSESNPLNTIPDGQVWRDHVRLEPLVTNDSVIAEHGRYTVEDFDMSTSVIFDNHLHREVAVISEFTVDEDKDTDDHEERAQMIVKALNATGATYEPAYVE